MTSIEALTDTSHGRPTVSDVLVAPSGERTFTLTFEPGQTLSAHSNPARLTISVTEGSGVIALEQVAVRALAAGDFVQLQPAEMHSIIAGPDGLELVVSSVENCCRMC